MEDLATRIKAAFNAQDLDALSELLAPNARWGEDSESEGFCHDRGDVIGRFRQLQEEGVHGRVEETITGPRGIAVRFHVDWPDPEDQVRPELHELWMAYFVTDGFVSEIHGQDDREAAIAAIAN